MPSFIKKTWFKALAALVLVFGLAIIILTCDVRFSYRNRIFPAQTVPQKPVIMVLGAALKPDGTPSDALLDRLKVGLDLYNQQKGRYILVTGDDGRFHSNEVAAMKDYYQKAGVRDIDVWVDGQGYRTYESCSRAKKNYNISQAIIVTQNFHLPRALYLCNKLGIQSVGVSADLHSYKDIAYETARDWLASFKAWIDINVWSPKPPV